jgi:hypothetical protein
MRLDGMFHESNRRAFQEYRRSVAVTGPIFFIHSAELCDPDPGKARVALRIDFLEGRQEPRRAGGA